MDKNPICKSCFLKLPNSTRKKVIKENEKNKKAAASAS